MKSWLFIALIQIQDVSLLFPMFFDFDLIFFNSLAYLFLKLNFRKRLIAGFIERQHMCVFPATQKQKHSDRQRHGK